MAEEFITDEKVSEFVAKVSNLRNDPSCKGVASGDIVLRAARGMGIGSAVMDLACAGLRVAVDREGCTLDDARFWIAETVGVSSLAGCFNNGWLEAFNGQFFGKVSGVRELPSPYELKMPREVGSRFRVMLWTAVAVAESRGKVGKIANNKVSGFRVVKHWSECNGWRADEGFTDGDRELLKSLVVRGVVSMDSTAMTNVIGEGDLADVRKRADDLQQKLGDEQRKSCQLDAQRQKLERELSELEKRTKAEREDCQKRSERDAETIAALEERVGKLQNENGILRDESIRERDALQRQLEEMQRQAVVADNRVNAQHDAIGSVVSPIHRQIEDVRGKTMSAEMCGVLMTHLSRIIDVLKENGIEF